ncbi:uracil-DNA glycosylase [Enterovirga rhinocerotis]|uniref:Type-4 uracil-DNA glycosylase n=1 Tax=Enterovirga rhinocerotis TaxID=1339210 RepID=A0A4R7C8Y2_9HYPH|nr:uracil-DNA glycosylase [Enterovirga rhinocerotis]TDR93785.1 DNA polymerase [Enterovirga rhinocerotis]
MDAAADRDQWIALLDFYVAAGVDVALDEAPHDRFAEADRPELPAVSRPPLTVQPEEPQRAPSPEPRIEQRLPGLPNAATQPAEVIAADARARAASARTLEELRALLDAFDGCALKGTARQLAFADGTPGSRVMILGEAPGAEEDRTGKPFVGRAGQLLDRMLGAIGLDRNCVYIANIVPWRPPGNRTPTPQEVAICLPFTQRQIELAAPDILLTLGAPSTQVILGLKEGITRTRGRWYDYALGERSLRVLPMLHPAYLLRQPLHKRFAWRDLRLLRRELDRGV